MYSSISILFLFPLYIFILCMGFKQWRSRRSAPAGATMSHFDVFTLHMMILEILGLFGSILYCLGRKVETLLTVGMFLVDILFPGQTLFHMLTCWDRYLAVVHPVTYMRLRQKSWIRIRNIVIMFGWVMCFNSVVATEMYSFHVNTILLLASLGFGTFVVLFCCLSILWVLVRPGPGEVGRPIRQADPSKQRAFYMIVIITGVLLVRFFGILVCYGIEQLVSIDHEDLCALLDSGIWLTVPSSLLLPLLSLHKAGKLPCGRTSPQSG